MRILNPGNQVEFTFSFLLDTKMFGYWHGIKGTLLRTDEENSEVDWHQTLVPAEFHIGRTVKTRWIQLVQESSNVEF